MPPVDDSPPAVLQKRVRSRIQLASHDDIAKELRMLHRRVEAGEIDGIEAVRRSKVLTSLAGVMTAAAVERRLAAVERELEKRRGR